ncbi:hypothetical protein NQD34_005666, partial [Periophthalmus magnuspinnatus]
RSMNHLVSWALLLVNAGSLLAHPITDSAEMPYQGPVSLEDHALGPLDDLSLSPEEAAAAFRLSTLLPVDSSRDGQTLSLSLSFNFAADVIDANSPPLVPQAAVFGPLSHVLGIRKHFRKRAGTADCFWKYCV